MLVAMMDRHMRDSLDRWLTTPPEDAYDRDFVEYDPDHKDAYGKGYPDAHEDEDDICGCPDHMKMRQEYADQSEADSFYSEPPDDEPFDYPLTYEEMRRIEVIELPDENGPRYGKD